METITQIDAQAVTAYFERLDALIQSDTTLFIFGGAAVSILGSHIRTTMDVDVAESYSCIDHASFASASAKAGLPVNPGLDCETAFLELVGPFRLAMPVPDDSHPGVVVYRGRNLVVKTGSADDLVASKLVRYDAQDQQDIQFLMGEGGATIEGVHEAVSRLQPKFRSDVLVRENLKNLESDLVIWGLVQ